MDFIIIDNGGDNRQPKRNENNKGYDKRLHIKEKYAPRKIEDEADGVDKKRVVFFCGIACKNDCRANAH